MNTKISFAISTFAACVLAFAMPGTVRGSTVFDTISLWDGLSSTGTWGGVGVNIPTFGQTFIAPSDNVLESIAFKIRNGGASSLDYQVFLFAWNGTRMVGSALFTGSVSTLAPSLSYQTINVDMDSTVLNAGQHYVVFFTTTTTGTTAGGVRWGQLVVPSPYPGMFVYSNATSFSGLSNEWLNHGSSDNLAFRFEFSVIPEPTTSALLMGGSAAAFLLLRKRKVKSE